MRETLPYIYMINNNIRPTTLADMIIQYIKYIYNIITNPNILVT